VIGDAPAPGADAHAPGAGWEARIAAAWRALSVIEDPEIPALTLTDLGIVRFVKAHADGMLDVGLSPTYSGCPATEYIRHLVDQALTAAEGVGEFRISHVLSPAWSSDWISSEGRRKLLEYGIVPPPQAVASLRQVKAAPIACPRCGDFDTECMSQFGSTPCKALHRCRKCLEPFECFKCI
jgi:ring-1,2-phenylacetyl-CoA epoxidase subunit PaaD